MTQLKTIEEVRLEFERDGVAIADWAKQHGFQAGDVYSVLQQKVKGTRGAGHKVAVALGLKKGRIINNVPEMKL